ncbi:hypothetical protein PsorP6_013582 [Peronosclerospora sorghi]|uniref:Uncharacterized protein n=1 Tax=Peronosclerospora sorghi TaxID=230839 RepID=A0ACC0VIJ5_9STRA|nr:hypothetical protein PsorP6_013582 [Peronosclerospora sorghi]
MKMRHRAIVSLKYIPGQRPSEGLLTIVRPKVFGGKLEISLRQDSSSLTAMSGKDARRRNLKIRYGRWYKSVTLRAPNSAIFEIWWTALENMFAVPNFVAIPFVDAREHQIIIAPLQPARPNPGRKKQTATLEFIGRSELETNFMDMPMLEAKGPSSPTEIDILASWRTWGSLEYFATPPSNMDSIACVDTRQCSSVAFKDGDSSDKSSLYSDISEFWSRPSNWEDKVPQDYLTPIATCAVPECIASDTPNPRNQADEKMLDAIALYVFRQRVGETKLPERHSSKSLTGRVVGYTTFGREI